jgi:hypothetical protein
VEAITVNRYTVIVTEHCARGLVGRDGATYASPPHLEHSALLLVSLLAGGPVQGPGPWRHAIAGGQRIIELRAAD